MVEVTTKQIGKWYKEAFNGLDKSIPLKNRYKIATNKVRAQIKQYKMTITLPTFFEPYPYQKNALRKNGGRELGEH